DDLGDRALPPGGGRGRHPPWRHRCDRRGRLAAATDPAGGPLQPGSAPGRIPGRARVRRRGASGPRAPRTGPYPSGGRGGDRHARPGLQGRGERAGGGGPRGRPGDRSCPDPPGGVPGRDRTERPPCRPGARGGPVRGRGSASVANFFDSDRPEAFTVVDVESAAGLRRDAVIITLGFGKTPHGRVLHRFGVLSGPDGAEFLVDALDAVRTRLTVV